MKHVSWPSRPLVIAYTFVVIGVSVITAVYLGLLDYALRLIIEQII